MIYLKINNIKGSVTTQGYKDSIEIFNYNFNSSRSVNDKTGLLGNRSAGLLQYSDLILTKPMDKATATLLKYYYDAKVLPEVSFHHVSTGSNLQCYFTNTFKDVLIRNHAMDCDKNGVTETFTFCFSSNQKRIALLNEQNKLSSPVSVGYDKIKAQAL